MRARAILVWVVLIMVGSAGFADEIEPDAIFKKVAAKYESMEAYSAEGTIVSDMDTNGMKMSMETSFSVKLKKPNLYLISWTQKNMPMPGMVQSGAVWSDGTQPYLYMGMMNAYSKMSSDEMALASATGISGGAAFTIPSFFLPVFKIQLSPFSGLVNPKIEKVEKVEDEECYVISGSSESSKKETFWISKTNYLILKCSRSLEPPEGGMPMPEINDEALEAAIKAMGLEVTEERKEQMKNMMKTSKDIMETAEIKGTSTELHVKISTPELTEKDFNFTLPEGTILKESLFGSMLSEEYTSPAVTYDPASSDKKILAERMEKYLSAVWTGKDEECFKLISPICIKNMGLTFQKFSKECQSLRNIERLESTRVEHVIIKDDLKHAEVLVTKDSWIRYGDATGTKIEEKREVGNPVYFWVKEGDTWYMDFSSNGNIY